MTDFTPPPIGTMVSIENTSDNADQVRDFYTSVLGWRVHTISMGDYDDYVMMAPDGAWVAGICHRRGPNADLPGGWIPCFRVASVEQALSDAVAKGGTQIGATRDAGPSSKYAVIQDIDGNHISVIDFEDE